MAVEVHFIGRFGNNLFQYALGRIIAEKLGYELICRKPPISYKERFENLSSGNYAVFSDFADHFPHAPLHISGKKIHSPQERYVLGESTWRGHGIPLQAILNNTNERRIVLRGYFQRMQYLEPYRDQVRKWFRPANSPYNIRKWFSQINSPASQKPSPEDVVLSIRRGYDYFNFGWVLSPHYYVDILEKIKPPRVYVCGVGIDDTIRSVLAAYNPVYYSGTPIEEFRFLSGFNRIILSNSTFAWWAAWVSDATEIFFPKCRSYWGEMYPDIELEVNESRYHYIEDVEMEIWRPFQRNPEVSVTFTDNESEEVIIVNVEQIHKTYQLCFSASCRSVLEWIIERTEKFGWTDLLPYADRMKAKNELSRILLMLICTGCIEADELYLNSL